MRRLVIVGARSAPKAEVEAYHRWCERDCAERGVRIAPSSSFWVRRDYYVDLAVRASRAELYEYVNRYRRLFFCLWPAALVVLVLGFVGIGSVGGMGTGERLLVGCYWFFAVFFWAAYETGWTLDITWDVARILEGSRAATEMEGRRLPKGYLSSFRQEARATKEGVK